MKLDRSYSKKPPLLVVFTKKNEEKMRKIATGPIETYLLRLVKNRLPDQIGRLPLTFTILSYCLHILIVCVTILSNQRNDNVTTEVF
jgi:hypothetical protein